MKSTLPPHWKKFVRLAVRQLNSNQDGANGCFGQWAEGREECDGEFSKGLCESCMIYFQAKKKDKEGGR